MVDYGDAPVIPADPGALTRRSSASVGEIVDAGAIPIVLGGDHSIAEPDIRASPRAGPVGLVHFDTHTDTGTEVFGVEISHGTPMYRLVRDGHVDPAIRPDRAARLLARRGRVRLAGEHGITSFFMHDVRDLGIHEVIEPDARDRRGTGLCSSRSTSTCWIPPSRPGRARPSRAG